MKLFGLLGIAVLLSSSEAIMKTRFRATKCFSLNETLASFNCNLKPYSRNIVTLNSVEIRKVLYEKPIEIKFKLHLRYGTIYRQVFHSEFEWCSAMDGTSNNIVSNTIMSLVKKSSPQLLETCPFPPGVREVTNMTLDDSTWPSAIPSGFWRFQFVFGKYWSMQFDTEVVSDIKTNMK